MKNNTNNLKFIYTKSNNRLLLQLLIIMMILIYLLTFSFGFVENNQQINNIDVFEITRSDITNLDDKKIENNKNKQNNSNKNKEKENKKQNNKKEEIKEEVIEEIIEDPADVFAYDSDDYFLDKNNSDQNERVLNIFNNPLFDNKQVIAPGSNGSYQFTIKNSNEFPIYATISMTEVNNYGFNIGYKLRNEDNFIVGNENTYFKSNKLNIKKIYIDSESEILYTLDWMWLDSSNDAHVGINDNSNYKLIINISAVMA